MTEEQKVKKDVAMQKMSKIYEEVGTNLIINNDNQYDVTHFLLRYHIEKHFHLKIELK